MLSVEEKDNFRWYVDSETKQRYISVTQVLDHIVPDTLQNWMQKNSQKKIADIKEHAAQTGTNLHKEIENFVGEGKEHTPHTKAFEELLKKHGYSVEICESLVSSSEYGYAGRLDYILQKDGKRFVGDLKTGRSFSPKTGWQLAAYQHAFNETAAVPCTGLVGIHIPRDAPERAKLFEYVHLDFCWHSFLASLQTFKGLYYTKLRKANWFWLERPIFN